MEGGSEMPLGPDGVVQVLLRERVRLMAASGSIVRDVNAADDVFQQVIVSVLEQRLELADPKHALAWGLRAVRFRSLDFVRRKQLRPIPDEVLDAIEARWADPDGTGRPDHVDALNRCLDKLAESARGLLRMKYHDGLTAAEIARQLRRTEDAVYQSLYRIHRALRACVDLELADSPAPEANP
jgi:RNA polymerase sigma-70 factor (ECF subfamily)